MTTSNKAVFPPGVPDSREWNSQVDEMIDNVDWPPLKEFLEKLKDPLPEETA